MRLRRSRHRLPGRLARLPRSTRSRLSSLIGRRRARVRIPVPPLSNTLAEGVGFEPTERFRSAVFKTAAFSRSAIPPGTLYLYQNTPAV